MIKQCLIALGIGCLAILWFLQYDPRVQERVGNAVLQGMEKAFDCTLQGRVSSLDFYSPCLEFENVYACARNGAWSWYAQRLKITCSWPDFLLYGIASLYIDVYGCRADSAWDGFYIGLWEFIDKLRRTTPLAIPIVLKSLHIHQAYIDICDTKREAKITYNLACNLKKLGKQFKAILHVHDTQIKQQKKTYLCDGQGTISFQADVTASQALSCSIDYRYLLSEFPHLVWIVHGSWDSSYGSLSIKSVDDAFRLLTTLRRSQENSLSGSLEGYAPLQLFAKILQQDQLQSINAQLEVRGTIKKEDDLVMHGWIAARDVCYKQHQLADAITASIDASTDVCSGTLAWSYSGKTLASGLWHYDISKKSGAMQIHDDLPTDRIPSQWCIEPRSTFVHLALRDDILEVGYQACLLHNAFQHRKEIKGNCRFENGVAHLKGLLDTFLYDAEVMYSPRFWMRSLSLKDERGSYVTVYSDRQDKIHASIDLAQSIEILHLFNMGVQMQAEGMLKIEGLIRDGCLYGACMLHDGAIRIPHVHNVIKDIVARCMLDVQKHNFIMRDVRCALHRGVVQCDRASVWWSDDGSIKFVHAPILLQDCFINSTKDFFAILSGYLVASWSAHSDAFITGSLFIDKAQLKYNLFSSQLQQHIFGGSSASHSEKNFDLGCDITIHTKDPLRVKTMFLETDAKIALQLTGSLKKPSLFGSIELLSGEFKFPYKPLYITKGSILFSRHADDPTIALFAKNSIKRYVVNLHVTGLLRSPQVLIESSPSLTEEQILALLLVGTEEDSLSFVLPAIIANNLKNLIFSSDQSFSAVERYMHRFLKPLRYIHVMPSFVDQSGRGGLRGALEVEVSDRLRAYLQKNFSLTEDARVEVEYVLSDEIRVKGVRDEHGDMGAEVEMRWKF
jgi:hypothetical protein